MKSDRATELAESAGDSLVLRAETGYDGNLTKEQKMRTYPLCVGLAAAVACSAYSLDFASAQGIQGQGPGGFPLGQTLENGNVGGNQGRNSDDYDQGYPRTELDSLPFTGRYRNSCYGPILIEENPAGITVSVNGRSVRAKDGAELRQRYPDAYRLYERTLGREKLLLLGRFAALKNSYSNANRALAGGGMPGPSDTNSPQDRGVSLMKNGKKVSITETKGGIAVSVDGKRVRANSVAQLRKRFPEAFRMFEEQLAAADGDDSQPAVK